MFVLINVFILLFFSCFWGRFDFKSKVILRFLIWSGLVFSFSSFYINGVDWTVYFSKFSYEDNYYLFLSFEPGFVIFLKALLFLTYGNFGGAIFCFFMITFGFLMYSLEKYKINEPLFLAGLILACGYTLILEQLRQFIACLIVFVFLINYNKNKSLVRLIFGVTIASFFHISALVVIPAVILCNIKNRFVFIVTTIIFGILFVLFLFFGLYILEQIPQFAFVVRKINFYLEQNPTILQLGWLNLFVLIYTVAYVFFSYSIERNSNANLLNRFIFVGSIIFIFSGTFPFLGRMTLYFIFIALYIISDPKKNWRIGNAIVVNGYFSIFLVLNFSSYFRNDLAPVDFDNLNYCFLNLFDNNYMQKIATENLPEMLVGE